MRRRVDGSWLISVACELVIRKATVYTSKAAIYPPSAKIVHYIKKAVYLAKISSTNEEELVSMIRSAMTKSTEELLRELSDRWNRRD